MFSDLSTDLSKRKALSDENVYSTRIALPNLYVSIVKFEFDWSWENKRKKLDNSLQLWSDLLRRYLDTRSDVVFPSVSQNYQAANNCFVYTWANLNWHFLRDRQNLLERVRMIRRDKKKHTKSRTTRSCPIDRNDMLNIHCAAIINSQLLYFPFSPILRES